MHESVSLVGNRQYGVHFGFQLVYLAYERTYTADHTCNQFRRVLISIFAGSSGT